MPVTTTRLACCVTAIAAVTTVLGVPAADAAPALTCTASMSNAHPAQYSTDYVRVRSSRAHSAVTTAAHYKSTTTTHTANTGTGRTTQVAYKISRASKTYRVKVVVTVRAGSSSGSCSTSFVPS